MLGFPRTRYRAPGRRLAGAGRARLAPAAPLLVERALLLGLGAGLVAGRQAAAQQPVVVQVLGPVYQAVVVRVPVQVVGQLVSVAVAGPAVRAPVDGIRLGDPVR